MLRCPHCTGRIDGSLNPSGRTEPRDWDPAVCPHCGTVAVYEFSAPGGLRLPDETDWTVWGKNPGLMLAIERTVAAVQKVDPDV
jgi:sarcosine oxidase delta subunit